MKFLVRNARGKIIEDAEEKRDSLIVTFKVSCVSSIIRIILVNIRILILLLSKHVKTRYKARVKVEGSFLGDTQSTQITQGIVQAGRS